MELIEEGNIEKKKYRFECDCCGCIFIADESEIEHLSPLAQMKDQVSVMAICPHCQSRIYM